MNILRRFDFYNWIRYRVWEKHHVLKLRYLKPGWTDKDEVLIHAMFEVLCRFLEDEPVDLVAWDADQYHAHAMEEMKFLYNWWKKRQKREDDNPIFKPGVEAPKIKTTPDKEWVNKKGKTERLLNVNFVHDSPEAEQIWDKACDDSFKWEEACYKEDEEMMKRLIAIRKFMWT